VGSYCKIRKIFSLKNVIEDTSNDEEAEIIDETSTGKVPEPIPKAQEFPIGTTYLNQVISVEKVRSHKMSMEDASTALGDESMQNISLDKSGIHIAFGSRMMSNG
jgi:hypothetical protein